MKKYIKSIFGVFAASLLLFACNSSSTNETKGHDEEGHREENTVSLTEQQMEAIGLKMVQVEERNMNVSVQSSGKLELAPQDRADISPILGGIVKKLLVFEGDKVKKGQVLAILEHPDFIQLQQDYINNINTLRYLEKEYERQKRLYEENVGSGRDFQKIQADYNNSRSSMDALKIKLNILGLNTVQIAKGTIYPTVNIVAPMKGTVSLVETNVGAFVEPLTKIFEIVDNDKIHADLMVYEKDINKVSVGQKINFTTSSLEGQELEGKIYAISPSFEDNPKAIHVHAYIISKKETLLPGMYIQGRIIADNILTTVLPDHSIITEEDKSYIFVKKEGKDLDHGDDKEPIEDHGEEKWTFEMVEIVTGISHGGFTQVKFLTALAENAQIAGNGAYYLLAEMGKGETEHSH